MTRFANAASLLTKASRLSFLAVDRPLLIVRRMRIDLAFPTQARRNRQALGQSYGVGEKQRVLLLGFLVQALPSVCGDRLLIAADLCFVSRQSGEVIRQRVERVETAIVLLALLPLGLDIDIHAELDAVDAAGPTDVVEELDASRIVNVGTVRATA